MKSGADGARRLAERFGHLDERVARVVVQHENRSFVGCQPAEATLQLVTITDAEQVVGCGRSIDRKHPQVHGPATLARRLADADIGDDTVHPSVESVRIAERPEVTPGDHQRILQSVLGPIDIAEDPVCEREQSVAGRADEVDESRLVAALGRLDEGPVAIHHCLS